jgi:hypothetical protein
MADGVLMFTNGGRFLYYCGIERVSCAAKRQIWEKSGIIILGVL